MAHVIGMVPACPGENELQGVDVVGFHFDARCIGQR
jgi:hypothetical protein